MEYISNSQRIENLPQSSRDILEHLPLLFFLKSDADHCLTFTLLNLPPLLPAVLWFKALWIICLL